MRAGTSDVICHTFKCVTQRVSRNPYVRHWQASFYHLIYEETLQRHSYAGA